MKIEWIEGNDTHKTNRDIPKFDEILRYRHEILWGISWIYVCSIYESRVEWKGWFEVHELFFGSVFIGSVERHNFLV